MNPEASQTPEPVIESKEQSPIEPVTSIEPSAELEEQSSTDESIEDTAVRFLVELEEPPLEEVVVAEARIAELQSQEQSLRQEIATLQASSKMLTEQLTQTQSTMGRVVEEALVQLEQRKQSLQITIEQLERRQERIRTEMRTTFAGASQELAIRVQGFKDYLTGSLQDLAVAAEQLELVPKAKEEPQKSPAKQPKSAEDKGARTPRPNSPEEPSSTPQFAEQRFESTKKQVRRLLDQYRNKPDYYGPPWQLRRTFEPVHAERVSNWFFSQGGRGALRTMGSRLQNILISSAVISVLHTIYGDRLRTLILANTPERLGEWRRGLQDCLGISRSDFGPERGVVLFEEPEPVAIKAERLIKANQMPFIIVDDSEDQISLSLLQFPLWLAFAPDPQASRDYDF